MAGATETFQWDGKTYTVMPLRDKDIAELEAWAQDSVISVTKRNIKDFPEAQQNLLLQDAFKRAVEVNFYAKEFWALLNTVEGASRYLWVVLRQAHPEFTLEQAREMSSVRTLFAHIYPIVLKLGIPQSMLIQEPSKKKKVRCSQEKTSTKNSPKGTGGRQRK